LGDTYTLDEKGTYIDIYFTGNNMPMVEFFGNSISGNAFAASGKKGFVVHNGAGPQQLYRNFNAIMDAGLLNKSPADISE
jgi:hypothetical protein